MPPSTVSLRLPVHPHQLEVQEFDGYGLIVDLRTSQDFGEDHVPGAVSMPWGLLSSALHTGSDLPGSATVLLTSDGLPGLPYGLRARLEAMTGGEPVLLVCGRGGADSAALAERLRVQGVQAEHLPGGYASYRRWVQQSIEVLAMVLQWRWVRSAPAGGAGAVLGVLQSRGLQVLSMAACLGRTQCPGLLMPGESSCSPAWFESQLVDVLRRHDPARPVWTDEVLLLDGVLELPAALSDRLRVASALNLRLVPSARAALLAAHLARQALGVDALASGLRAPLGGPPGGPGAAAFGADDAAEPMAWTITVLDRLYRDRAHSCRAPQRAAPLELVDLQEADVWAALSGLPEPWPQALAPDPDQINP